MQIIIWLVRLFEERNALLKYLRCIQAHSILNLKNILQKKTPALPHHRLPPSPSKKTPKNNQSQKPQKTPNKPKTSGWFNLKLVFIR